MCFFCLFISDLDRGLVTSLVSVASRLGSQFVAGLNAQQCCQVHQFFIACDIEESLGLRLPASIHALKVDLGPACKSAFFTAPAQPSASQQQVSDTLRGMGLWVEDSHQRLSTSEQGSQKSAVTADLERKGMMNPNAGEFIPEFPPPGGVCASRPSAPAHVTAEGP
jgi:hypothetical protein